MTDEQLKTNALAKFTYCYNENDILINQAELILNYNTELYGNRYLELTDPSGYKCYVNFQEFISFLKKQNEKIHSDYTYIKNLNI
jgi:hypothetical protein